MDNKDQEIDNIPSDQPEVHSLQDSTDPVSNTSSAMEMPFKKVLMIFGFTIIAGIATGFGAQYVQSLGGSNGGSGADTTNTASQLGKGDDVAESAGIADPETFSDSATGVIEDGGHESGVGSHKLIRPGGDDQTAYLTSSTVDLSEFAGKKVRIYGETFGSDQVSWLLDVGYVEVLK